MTEKNENGNSIDDIISGIQSADDEFIKDIKRYWSITTSYENIGELLNSPIRAFKRNWPNVPDHEWNAIIEDFNVPGMEGDFINHFMNHFSHQELTEILYLYDYHPLLQKSKEKNKLIVEDTNALAENCTLKLNNLIQNKIDDWTELGYLSSDD